MLGAKNIELLALSGPSEPRPRQDRDLKQKVETRPRLERTETRHETFEVRVSQKVVNTLTVNI